ncbi:putative Glutamate receptor-like 88, partial [Homarus americanus]
MTDIFTSGQVWSCREVLATLMEQELLGCSFTIISVHDDFSAALTPFLVALMITHSRPYQVVSVGGGDDVRPAWHSTSCDVYVIVAKRLLVLSDLLDTDDDSWDWQGRYLMFTSSSSANDLQRLAVTYKLQKTTDVLFFIRGTSDSELAVYTHKMYSKRSLKLLTLWRDGGFVKMVDLFPNKVNDLRGQQVRVLAVNHAPSVFSIIDHLGLLHNVSGLDVK